MGNHVVRDRIWHSRKLRKCSRDAALAWPWIFLVADEWGRFEFDARLIWKDVFAAREDVSEDDVKRWLSEYEHFELLERYHIDGELAVWTNFEGRPPTRRRASKYPDPEQFKRVRKKGARREATVRKNVGDRTFELELEQETGAGAGDKSVPAVIVPELSLVGPLSWSAEALTDWREFMGGDPQSREAFFPPLRKLVDEHPWSEVRPRFRRFLAELRAGDPQYIGKGSTGRFAAAYGAWGAEARASLAAQARRNTALATIQGGASDGRGLDRGDEVVVGELTGPGPDSGHGAVERGQLPSGPRAPDRR